MSDRLHVVGSDILLVTEFVLDSFLIRLLD